MFDIKTHYDICNAIRFQNEKYRLKKKWLEVLRQAKHGHIFNENRICKCGLSEKDYYYFQIYETKLCGLVEKL
jgi:hypothetical protein